MLGCLDLTVHITDCTTAPWDLHQNELARDHLTIDEGQPCSFQRAMCIFLEYTLHPFSTVVMDKQWSKVLDFGRVTKLRNISLT